MIPSPEPHGPPENPDDPSADDTATDDPIAAAILSYLEEREAGTAVDPQIVARAVADSRAKKGDPTDLWRRYLPAVRQQALHLARHNRLVILRKGKPADPHAPIKGLIKLTLPAS